MSPKIKNMFENTTTCTVQFNRRILVSGVCAVINFINLNLHVAPLASGHHIQAPRFMQVNKLRANQDFLVLMYSSLLNDFCAGRSRYQLNNVHSHTSGSFSST